MLAKYNKGYLTIGISKIEVIEGSKVKIPCLVVYLTKINYYLITVEFVSANKAKTYFEEFTINSEPVNKDRVEVDNDFILIDQHIAFLAELAKIALHNSCN